jgi:hypothetical protein
VSADEVATVEVAGVGRRIAGQLVSAIVPLAVAVTIAIAGDGLDAMTRASLFLGPAWLVLAGGHLGHLLLGMRAVTNDGKPTWGQAAIRVAVFVALPLYVIDLVVDSGLVQLADFGWSVALLATLVRDSEHRALHDRAAGTTVVLLPKP